MPPPTPTDRARRAAGLLTTVMLVVGSCGGLEGAQAVFSESPPLPAPVLVDGGTASRDEAAEAVGRRLRETLYRAPYRAPLAAAQLVVSVLLLVAMGLLVARRTTARHAEGRGPRLHVTENPRMLGGMLRDRRVFLVLWTVAIAGTTAALWTLPQLDAPSVRAAIGAAVGGATSNVADQMLRGHVTDFIDLRVWPVFNLADVAIVAGVMGAFLSAW